MIRRAIGTTLAGLCALVGPLAASALADAVPPSLELSTSVVRQGLPFRVSSQTPCPSEDGVQTVSFSFTDSAGVIFPIGSTDTADDGSWADATVQLPVAGVDDSGTWLPNGAATGAGTIDATCWTADDSTDPGTGDDGSGDDSWSDDGSGDDGTGDDGTGDGVVTLTYASADVARTESAPQLTTVLSADGGTVTVTPSENCTGSGASDVDLAVVGVDDNAGDPLATATATSSDTGAWEPVDLSLPDDSTGDFAVTATCSQDGTLTSSYDAQPLALGTVLLSKPDCTRRGAIARVSGSYTGTVMNGDKDLTNGVLKLAGAGPWQVTLTSSGTGQVLLTKSLACTQTRYDLSVSKPGVTGKGQVRVRVCNTGNASAVAVLQVRGKRMTTVDTQSLDPGECSVLQGGTVRRNSDAAARVLLDPPGGGSSDTTVSDKFTVHRGKH